MTTEPEIKPLPLRRRRTTFFIAVVIFVVTLPFIYLYATGYRFEFGEDGAIVSSTGGMYVAAERTGAEIFIDDELVRETRVFRRAFYAQSLEPTTHKVSVQKDGHHTWVKELPVYPHLVTEAQAFNMPLNPQVRVISPYQTATGSAVVSGKLNASTTNPVVATSTTRMTTFEENDEYAVLFELFSTSTPTSTAGSLVERVATHVQPRFGEVATTATSAAMTHATTSKESRGVKLYERDGDIYASWIGTHDDIPYYYCAEPFERYSTSTEETREPARGSLEAAASEADEAELIHPVQSVEENTPCDPTVRLDRRSEEVKYFDFFPGSTDLVMLALESGVYVVEIDDRGWQNVQPVFEGEGLDARVENGQIYVYDGEYIYQIILDD